MFVDIFVLENYVKRKPITIRNYELGSSSEVHWTEARVNIKPIQILFTVLRNTKNPGIYPTHTVWTIHNRQYIISIHYFIYLIIWSRVELWDGSWKYCFHQFIPCFSNEPSEIIKWTKSFVNNIDVCIFSFSLPSVLNNA